MNKYETILFDVDDTLINFEVDQKTALKKAIEDIGYECTNNMYEDYNKINSNMWKLLDEGKIKLQEIFVKRFEILFDKYNINKSPKEFDKLLTLQFQKTGTPIKGAKDVLENLKKEYKLVVTSNGPKEQQYHRLKNAGFLEYFSNIFISEEIGYNKPDINFFNIVFREIDTKDKSKILMVGDAIVSDIKGGKDAGIDTCWYNIKNEQNVTDIKPTYEICKLEELIKLMK